jgi:Reverse transcriptase (RNA-dependent DNA polymerase)
VAREDLTKTPLALIYSSIVTREIVRNAFVIAALNGLDIMMLDVGNAYLNAQPTEKLYCYAGKEFGADEEGKLMIKRRASYGLKSLGVAYCAHFARTLIEIGFRASKADSDIWLREAKKEDGDKYYKYMLTYVDDCLIVSHQPKWIISTLENKYNYKLKDVGEPKRYLGAEIGKYRLPDGYNAWYMSARLYLQQAITEVERQFGNLLKIFKPSTLDVPI